MSLQTKILTAALIAGITGGAGSALAVGDYDKPVTLDLAFKFHIDDDIPEQDVFVEGADGIYRPTKGERDLSKPLYAPASPVKHAPFEPEKVGPWPKGRPLGVTLGEWLAAEGKGTYSCSNGEGHLSVEFTKLVPNGVYTFWHYFLAWPPTDPFLDSYDIPVGARDGSDSVFIADADGNATVERTFKPCLQLTGEHLASGLAIAWHSDGKTYGALPGEFSTKSHVQLYYDLPKRSGI